LRSRAAAATLTGAGFRQAYSMEGGINAWRGLTAEGLPDSGMAYFTPATRPEELIALAWYLEKGSHTFYSELSQRPIDQAAKDLFKELAVAEEHHQASLSKLHQDFTGATSTSGFPDSVIPPPERGEVMEGGMHVSEALEWAGRKPIRDVLELSVSLEANSYDLHLRMKARMEDARSKEVFAVLSREEKDHLDQLSSLLEKKL
jgi:rubrerythrin